VTLEIVELSERVRRVDLWWGVRAVAVDRVALVLLADAVTGGWNV
jgi:hypothetical protein